MRLSLIASLLLSSLLISPPASAQQPPPQRDPQALVVLQQALAAMGGVVPADSVATGNADLVAGSTKETATVRVLTRGLDQTAEQIQTTHTRRTIVYSRRQAAEFQGTSAKRLHLERVATAQSPDFPLIVIAAALGSADSALQYVGLESLNGRPVQHVRTWNTFASNPDFQFLAEFTVKDFWIDVASGLPLKSAYLQRDGGGAVPRIPVEVFFSDYRNVAGILYPFLTEKSFNGTPWARIAIQQVAFNTGVTDGDFPLQ